MALVNGKVNVEKITFVWLFKIMITLQQIRTSDFSLYDYAEKLMVSSFPLEEYRDLVFQRKLTDMDFRFAIHIILENNLPVGFFGWWNLDEFLYIEHFAIDQLKRNHGLGQKALEAAMKMITLPIVIETEPPVNEISRRRIGFYLRNGFSLFEQEYLQPPYREGYSFLPLQLMFTGDLNGERDFERIKTILYREVYRLNDNR